ncbi:hypothetical protein L9F63_006580 [Diploptera punctata]|uniref:K Homology domain-containing protein n=1 Tax=Diploptera punctata TaxID=6984 RepID=A0AAD8E4S8_DIPPU|nr:hypothetical protein L9F63_006580 [Diploptera punctata]
MWNAAQSNMAADSGMDTCPSPEIPDSRKRPLDSEVENGTTKRSHYGGGGDGTFHFKMLVPSVAAGAIIGKGGETIAQLQKDTGARVKMSKANDFYPGTSERVCLITGNVEAIMAVLTFIMEKIREKPDINAKQAIDFDNKTSAERDKQVKILVPNSTAGMIIGKGGNYIKQIKEESGSYVQISQKAKDQTLQERCITVIGEMECNKTACLMILSKVVEDPQSGSCLNVSYADVSGPVANYNPTGSPYANHSGQHAGVQTGNFNSSPNLGSSIITAVSGMVRNGSSVTVNVSLDFGNPSVGPANASVNAQYLEHIKVALRSSGYSDQATSDITSAMGILAQYGILSMRLGSAGAPSPNSNSHHLVANSNYLGVGPMDSTPSPQTANGVGNNGVFGAIGTTIATSSPMDRFGESVTSTGPFDPFRHQSSPTNLSPISLNNNSFGLGTGQSLCKSPIPSDLKGDQKKVDVEIAENIVGAILGPGGKSLVEIQHLSGANIQISKKGTFAPGTRNRIVSIAGTPNAISTAQYLIEQRISEEEAKRARHNALGLLQ